MKLSFFAVVLLVLAEEAFCSYTNSRVSQRRSGEDRNLGRNCEALSRRNTCDFYSQCVKPDVTSCRLREVTEAFCRQTKNGEGNLNAAGKKYIKSVRKCLRRNLISSNDVISCSTDDVGKLLTPSDIKSDCVYQNVSLCAVLSSKQNARGLIGILSSLETEGLPQQFIRHFLSLTQSCNERAKQHVNQYLPEVFLDQMTLTTAKTTEAVPKTTPTHVSTRTAPPSDPDCQELSQTATSCDFYGACVKTNEVTCGLRDDVEDFCKQSIAAEATLDSLGQTYLQTIRGCLQKNLLAFDDVTSCDLNREEELDKIFAPTDIKSDCIYQNVSLCAVLTSTSNVQALFDMFSSLKPGQFQQQLVKRLNVLAVACNARARDNFKDIFPEDLSDVFDPDVNRDLVLTECLQLSQEGNCKFYSQCVNVGVASCYARDQSHAFCLQTEARQDQLDREGLKYTQNVRKCLMKRQYTLDDNVECDTVDTPTSTRIIRPNGIKSDCLFQDGGVCTVLSNTNNANVIRDMFVSSGSGKLENYVHSYLSDLVEQHCSLKVRSIFSETFKSVAPSTPPPQRVLKGCEAFSVNASCRFFPSCLSVPTSDCRMTSQIHEYCVNSERRQSEFDSTGLDYIENVRRCQIRKLLKLKGASSCGKVDVPALETLVKVPGCLWQQGKFCQIVSTEKNCIALFHVYGLGGNESDMKVKLFLTFNQLASQCSPEERDTFNTFFSQKFLASVQNDIAASTTTTTTTTSPSSTRMMMMMGRNGD